MEIIKKKISELVPYANNAKRHNEDQVLKIASSIREFGFNVPVIIDKDSNIIAGHGRTLAAKKIGMDSVPCIMVDHLSDMQRKAFALAENKVAEVGGEWDEKKLKTEIESLLESVGLLDAAGFTDTEIDKLLAVDLEDEESQLDSIAKMELQPFEKYDYIMLLFDNDQEFSNACERLEIKQVAVEYNAKCKKVGLGRVVKGSKFLEIVNEIHNSK
jgi:hypothetical protein